MMLVLMSLEGSFNEDEDLDLAAAHRLDTAKRGRVFKAGGCPGGGGSGGVRGSRGRGPRGVIGAFCLAFSTRQRDA